MVQGIIADIGATNARFALVDGGQVCAEQILKCADHDGIAQAAQAYLDLVKPDKPPQRGSFAIAGPITGDHFQMTNHPWVFSVRETQAALKLDQFHLMNDFKAIALAVPHLTDADRRQVGGGKALAGCPVGIIGPGTGLGVASLIWDEAHQRFIAVPGEGGHVTVPIKTRREFGICQVLLRDKYSHVSAERVCSGKGLVNLYNALRELDNKQHLPERTPEQISESAFDGSCALSLEALELMCRFLGRVAGNLALTLGAQGGIYIGGGIIGRFGTWFDDTDFRDEFAAKGRFTDYMEAVPTYVITNNLAAFIGLRADLLAEPPAI